MSSTVSSIRSAEAASQTTWSEEISPTALGTLGNCSEMFRGFSVNRVECGRGSAAWFYLPDHWAILLTDCLMMFSGGCAGAGRSH